MKITQSRTFWGAILAFILATSCCWIPAILIGLGGVSIANSIMGGLNIASAVFFAVGTILIAYAGYLFFFRNKKKSDTIILISTITCPECGFSTREEMPTDACQFFYECNQCHIVLKPFEGDCCVFCSFGNVPCPPIQANTVCC